MPIYHQCIIAFSEMSVQIKLCPCILITSIVFLLTVGNSWYILNARPLFDMWFANIRSSQVVLVVKNLPANAGDTGDVGSIPGSERCPGVSNVNPIHYSCLENSKDRSAWQATVHGVAKSQTWLSASACAHTHSIPSSRCRTLVSGDLWNITKNNENQLYILRVCPSREGLGVTDDCDLWHGI